LARRARFDRSRVVLASLLDEYLDEHLGHLGDVPAAARAQSHPPESNRRPTDDESL
jgi:hypothetical protein